MRFVDSIGATDIWGIAVGSGAKGHRAPQKSNRLHAVLGRTFSPRKGKQEVIENTSPRWIRTQDPPDPRSNFVTLDL